MAEKYITLHNANETNFNTTGLMVLDPFIINPVITETINSNYTFEFEILGDAANAIRERMIINAPTRQGYEQFRVRIVEKDMNNYGTTYFYCTQLFYCDMEDNFIENLELSNLTGSAALSFMSDNTQYSHPFKFYSDISVTATSYVDHKNFVTALIGNDDESFVNVWGGELSVHGFDVKMNSSIGSDRGVRIEYRKNLTGLNAKIDYSSYYTRVMPVGANDLYLDEKYIDSPNIDSSHPIVRLVKFDYIKVKQNDDDDGYNTIEEAKAALKVAANKLFSEGKVDVPESTYEVEFEELSQFQEYQNYTALETVFIGDTVRVYHDGLNIEIATRCVETQYNPITDKYISIKLGTDIGTFSNNTQKDQNYIENKVESNSSNFQNKLDQAVQHLTDLINSGLYGHVIINQNEILIMDTTDINTAVEVWRYNINGIAYSSTGYNGPFIGLTKDGKMVINEATAYAFTAALINTGLLKSNNNVSWINMDNGTFSLASGQIAYDGGALTIKIGGSTDLNQKINGLDSSVGNLNSSVGNLNSALDNMNLTVTQTNKKWEAAFSTSNANNMFENSDALFGNNGAWISNGGGISVEPTGAPPFPKNETQWQTTFPNGAVYYKDIPLKANTDYIYEGYVFTNKKLTTGSGCPLNFWCWAGDTPKSDHSACDDLDYRQDLVVDRFAKVYVHFRTKNLTTGNIYGRFFVHSKETAGIAFKRMSLKESTIETEWSQHPNEVYTAYTTISAKGLDVKNGALSVTNNDGIVVWSADDKGNMVMRNGNFHVISSKGYDIASIDQNNWMKVQGIHIFGNGECMRNTGAGTRSLILESTDNNGTTHIDFNAANDSGDYGVRLIREGQNSRMLKCLCSALVITNTQSNSTSSIELRSNGGPSYIDFSHDASSDYATRIITYQGDSRLHVAGGLVVDSGTKSAMQTTEHYGNRLMYAVESCENFFEDTYKCELVNGECIVKMDPIFLECVNTKDYDYYLSLDEWDECEGLFAPKTNRTATQFLVKEKHNGTSNIEFSVTVRARRKDFEEIRLEKIENNYEMMTHNTKINI